MIINSEGLLVELDNDGIILKVIYNQLSVPVTKDLLPVNNYAGRLFTSLFPEELTAKALSFLVDVKTKSASFGWEFFIKGNKDNHPFYFGGGIIDGRITVFGSPVKLDFSGFVTGMMMMNNEQVERIRNLEKEKIQKSNSDMKTLFDELSRLNNEMANYQREMAKKNIELSELNRIKNQFLGMAAHDLRNPLSNILMLSQFLRDEGKDLSEEQLEFIKLIYSSASAMLDLVNELLDVSSIESGEIKLNKEETDLIELMNKIVELNSIHAERKDIKINFKKVDNLERISIDSNKIQQVMANLLTNAIKYSFPGTNVTVSIEQDGDIVRISVKDEGQGIPESELKNLFKPFQKTSVKTTGGESSTGLGLFIVKKIVESHGGEIKVESKVGEGSVFSFSLRKTNKSN